MQREFDFAYGESQLDMSGDLFGATAVQLGAI